MSKRKSPELEVIRAFSIVGILILHSSFHGRFSTETLSVQQFLARLFDWSVLGFFFVSGVLRKTEEPFFLTLKKRFVMLMVPYFIYEILYRAFFAGAKAMGCTFDNASVTMHGSPLDWLLNSPAFQLYFLPYLFAISLVAGLMDLLFKRRRHVVCLTLMLCVLIFYVANGYPQNSHGPEWQKIPAYAFAFLFGNFSRRYLSVMPAVKSLSAVTLAGVLILLVLPAKPIASMFVAPALLWALISFPLVGVNKLLVDLGGFSGSIYLWHTPVLLPLLTKVLAGIGVPSLANFILSLLLALGVCILAKLAFTVAFRKWLHCPMPRWLTL